MDNVSFVAMASIIGASLAMGIGSIGPGLGSEREGQFRSRCIEHTAKVGLDTFECGLIISFES